MVTYINTFLTLESCEDIQTEGCLAEDDIRSQMEIRRHCPLFCCSGMRRGCLAIKAGRHTGTPIPWADVHPRDEQPCEEVCPCVGAASSGELLPLASLTVGWSEKKVQLLGQHSAMTGTGRLLA